MTQRDEHIQKLKSQFNGLNAKMGDVAAKVNDSKQEARAKYRNEVAGLHHQSRVAAVKLEELKAAGADRRESIAAELDKMRDALVHSFHHFKSQI